MGNLPGLAVASSRLPNPEMWTLVARAYVQLAREWPQYAINVGSSSLADIAQVGASVQRAARNANSLNNTPSTPNQQLFTALTAKYKAMAATLQQNVALFESNTFIPNNSCNSTNFAGCIPPNVDLWSNPAQQTSYVPSLLIDGCDGSHPFHLSAPGGILYAVPAALLIADSKAGSQISLCADATFTDAGLISHLRVTLSAKYRGAVIATMSIISAAGTWNTALAPIDCVNIGWGGTTFSGLKGQFVDHSQIALVVQPWALSLYNTLKSQQTAYYGQVAQQFKTPLGTTGAAIHETAQELTGIKSLLTAYITFGLPMALQNNDSLRSLLYGTQSVLDGDAVRVIYQNAASGTPPYPELDLTVSTTPLISAVDSAIGSILQQTKQLQSPDSPIQIDTVVSDIGALKALVEASSRDGNGNPAGALSFCHYEVTPKLGVVDSAGGSETLAVQAIVGGNCKWTASSGASWLSVAGGQTGGGNGNVSLTVAPNSVASPRIGIAVVGDQVVRIIQSAASSTVTLYTLSGRVLDASGNGVANVTVTLSGAQSATMTTGSDGSYQFTSLAAGNYIVTPSKTGYAFTPSSASMTNLSASQTANFTARAAPVTYTIGGKVLDGGGNAEAGVTVTLSGATSASTTTAADGGYQFTGLAAGSYTVAPSKNGYSFVPPSSAFTSLAANQTANFTAAVVPTSPQLQVSDASGRPGGTVDVPINFVSAGASVAAMQFELDYDPTLLTYSSARAGTQLVSAGKSLTVSPSAGKLLGIGAGFNQSLIGDGQAAVVTFGLSPSFPVNGTTAVACTNVKFVDAQGKNIAATGVTGNISATTCDCDMNHDGVVNIVDVQMIVNQVLGISPATCDLNGDGKIDIVDVQIVVNASLGLGCNR